MAPVHRGLRRSRTVGAGTGSSLTEATATVLPALDIAAGSALDIAPLAAATSSPGGAGGDGPARTAQLRAAAAVTAARGWTETHSRPRTSSQPRPFGAKRSS